MQPGAVTHDPLQDLRWRLQMSEQVRRTTVRLDSRTHARTQGRERERAVARARERTASV